ncbi:hypothetical protein CYMTET_3614 [Cymbomonas tetramitiformis]|uniref:Methyltransferase domain-containing protein n=1 Tax=Cymbomonas tetramitiformis TaxID=36881 RepID=A0AAE0H300_9CHLO|nr:hypothetical protein CYMTET_3614 [Cymbomonas tetramitiformis]
MTARLSLAKFAKAGQLLPRTDIPGCRTTGAPKSEEKSVDKRNVLTREKAREVYDASGRKANDTVSPYGAPASEVLLRIGRFDEAEVILEYGHGTGTFARRLFERGILRPSVEYIGIDQSPVMMKLASESLQPYKQNVTLISTPNGDPLLGTRQLKSGSVDRYLSTYVFDLLSEDDIASALHESYRLLQPDGLLCVSGITYGNSLGSRLACAIWELVRSFNIEIVGGCRPQKLAPYLEKAGYRIKESYIVQGDRSGLLGFMNSEVLIAQKI